MRWLLVLVAWTGVARADAYEEVPIASITASVFDPEGGYASSTVYATGYMHYSGHASCCGFQPRFPDGWYRAKNAAELQDVFDAAAMAIAYPAKTKSEYGEGGVELPDGTKVEIDGGGAAGEIAYEPAREPSKGAKTIVVGKRLRDPAVRDVIWFGEAARAKALSRDEAVVLIKHLERYAAGSPFVEQCLAVIAQTHADLVTGALANGKLQVAAIGATRSVPDLVAAAKQSPAGLEAATRALIAIGGRDATAALAGTILPALGAGDPATTDDERATNRVASLHVLDPLVNSPDAAIDAAAVAARTDALTGLGTYVGVALAGKPSSVLLVRVVEILVSRQALPARVDQAALAKYVLASLGGKDRAGTIRIATVLATDPPPARLLAAIRALARDKDPDVASEAESFVERHGGAK